MKEFDLEGGEQVWICLWRKSLNHPLFSKPLIWHLKEKPAPDFIRSEVDLFIQRGGKIKVITPQPTSKMHLDEDDIFDCLIE